MATTGVVNGTNLRVYVGGNVVAYATSCTFDLSAATRETIHKDNPGNGWAEFDVGQLSGTISVDALYSEDGANNTFGDLFTSFSGKTSVALIFQTAVSGDTKYTCSAYITALSSTAEVEQNSTFTATFTIDGQVTKATIT